MNTVATNPDNLPRIKVALTDRAKELGLTHPVMHHEGDIGIDLASMESMDISPQSIGRIPTGLIIEIPDFGPRSPVLAFGEIQSRTGCAMRNQLVPGPQIVDCGYIPDKDDPEGLVIGMINHGTEPVTVETGDRLAQIVIKLALNPSALMAPVHREEINYETDRGSARFGSTGVTAPGLGLFLSPQ